MAKKPASVLVQMRAKRPFRAFKVSLGELCAFCAAPSPRAAELLLFRKDFDFHHTHVRSVDGKRLYYRVTRCPDLDDVAQAMIKPGKIELSMPIPTIRTNSVAGPQGRMSEVDRLVSERLVAKGAVVIDNVWRMGSVQWKWNPGSLQPWTVVLLTQGGQPLQVARCTSLLKALEALEDRVSAWMGVVQTYK